MPAAIIKSFAKKSGKSEEEVEKLWSKAKKLAKEESGVEDFNAYAVGVLKKMLKLESTEELTMSFKNRLDELIETKEETAATVDANKPDIRKILDEFIKADKDEETDE